VATLDQVSQGASRSKDASSRRRASFQSVVTSGVLWLFILFGLVLMVLPGVWMALSSFKTRAEIVEIPLRILPHALLWSNYAQAIDATKFTRVLGNSLIITVSITVINVVSCTWGGYTFGKLRWPGRDTIFLGLLSTMMIPLFLTVIPRYVIVSWLHMQNSYAGMILPFACSAFGIFLTKQYMLSIPDELLDAAKVDGASALTIYTRIILPLCTPVIAVLAIFVFQWNWDDLLWATLILTDRNMWTLAVAIANLRVQAGDLVELQMAGSTLAVLPVLLVFAVLQQQIVRAVTISGLKG
jgi:ABC-type glycerol-3-phosphate transport system permease component